MHIEPGVVQGAKMLLSYATAAASLGFAAKLAVDAVKVVGLGALAVRTVLTTALVFCFFEVLPHFPVGVSEVHFILGTTLFLLFGVAATALGLAGGLLLQGLLFAPADLPQYAVNVTTLLVPLFAMAQVAKAIIPPATAYRDLQYGQVLQLSLAFQGGVVVWVAFWALYGQGFGGENLAHVASFGGAYLLVVALEPVVDLAVLAAAKGWSAVEKSPWLEARLHRPAHS
ncbi:MAG: energy-coupling factor ABC transporter permease [Candidatus Competibacterales bacterium]